MTSLPTRARTRSPMQESMNMMAPFVYEQARAEAPMHGQIWRPRIETSPRNNGHRGLPEASAGSKFKAVTATLASLNNSRRRHRLQPAASGAGRRGSSGSVATPFQGRCGTRDRNFTQAKMERRLAQIDESIARYLSQLDSADRQGETVPEAKITRLNEKIATLRQEIQRLNALNVQMMQTEDKQISLTDPDARSMATSGRGSGMVGYNVQSAVDTKHHLIVAHEVTNVGSDRSQLSHMAKRACAAIGSEAIEAVADRGYYSGEEIVACEQAGITVYLPKPMTSGLHAKGRFGKQDFVYVAAADVYLCPAGEQLPYRYTNEEDGKTLRRYWTTACQVCALKSKCTTGKERRISRWEHEAVLEAVQARLDRNPDKMRLRRQTVEHPFGTIKSWMGSTHFQMKRLKNVRTEMALHVLAYNMKRVMHVLGVGGLIEAIRA